ncbi:MAG TPA: hypothetical protein PL110_21055 [Candidatus Eremiobacteraeota bacterium]|nr:MAG: hypothetical protein BWY64_03228 [bacterium ADurb.Bin363]HPZ10591.1 hypothetical protein [Candidatus Eremiobacteraeota bacterium]
MIENAALKDKLKDGVGGKLKSLNELDALIRENEFLKREVSIKDLRLSVIQSVVREY